jgi:hypothetical protein
MPFVINFSLLTIFFFFSVDFKLRKATLCGRALQVVLIRHNAEATRGLCIRLADMAKWDLTRKPTCCLMSSVSSDSLHQGRMVWEEGLLSHVPINQ